MANIAAITFDCADAAALGGFWAGALGREVADNASEHFALLKPGDGGPPMMFIKVPEGKTAKNRVHLDLSAADPQAEVARLVGLGAEHVHDKAEWGVEWTTLRDPEGNEFCVSAPHN
jgi:catechol 2,3-dioxygenase-like lactoylglutathione lyase family enzyme